MPFCPAGEKTRTFIRFRTGASLAYRSRLSGHLLPRHENLEEIAPFHSVCIHDAARRWLLQEFPVDRYLREGIAAAVWRRQRQRGEGVVVRTRIFCLVHGSTETQRVRGAQPINARHGETLKPFSIILLSDKSLYIH